MLIRNSVRAAVAIVSVATFILLYYGLVDLARIAGMNDSRAYLYPIAIDGVVFTAYAATLYPDLTAGGRGFAWFVIVLGSVFSLIGQWLHAEQASNWQYAGPVAAAPALLMSLVWHLLFLVTRPVPEPVEKSVDEPLPLEIPPGQITIPEPEEERQSTFMEQIDEWAEEVAEKQRTRVADSDMLKRAVESLQRLRDSGQEITGTTMAQEMALDNAGTPSGRRTGLRWLRKAEEVLDYAAA